MHRSLAAPLVAPTYDIAISRCCHLAHHFVPADQQHAVVVDCTAQLSHRRSGNAAQTSDQHRARQQALADHFPACIHQLGSSNSAHGARWLRACAELRSRDQVICRGRVDEHMGGSKRNTASRGGCGPHRKTARPSGRLRDVSTAAKREDEPHRLSDWPVQLAGNMKVCSSSFAR